ncbi:MAG: hypothetical protein K2M94_05965 [Paramuribaculum sp.]|nr:hypothetical protein [Paramuribaculum sp.]
MKWLKTLWRDLVEYINWQPECEIDRICDEAEKLYEAGEKYERLQKHYPNILARLNEAVERKERR